MLAQEFKTKIYTEYMNSDGHVMVQNRVYGDPALQWIGMGNALMNTGLFFTILAELGALTQNDQDWLRNVILKSTVNFQGGKQHGLIHRSPAKFQDPQTQDDYYTLLSAAYHAGDRFAVDVLNHGRKTNWHWDNLRPEGGIPDTWFDRFPGFVPYVRLCAKDEISVYEAVPLISSIVSTAWSKADNGDSRIHRWCQATVFRKEEKTIGALTADVSRWITHAKFGSIPAGWAPYFKPTVYNGQTIVHPFNLVEGLR